MKTITGTYKSGSSVVNIGGGFYRDKVGAVSQITGGYVRSLDGQVGRIAQVEAPIISGTILATVNSALGDVVANKDVKLPSATVHLNTPINSVRSIPNGMKINAATTVTSIGDSNDLQHNSGTVTFNSPVTYDQLTQGNGAKLYYDASMYPDDGGPAYADYGSLNYGIYAKLIDSTDIQFKSINAAGNQIQLGTAYFVMMAGFMTEYAEVKNIVVL